MKLIFVNRLGGNPNISPNIPASLLTTEMLPLLSLANMGIPILV